MIGLPNWHYAVVTTVLRILVVIPFVMAFIKDPGSLKAA
jgi:hypothetical protein